MICSKLASTSYYYILVNYLTLFSTDNFPDSWREDVLTPLHNLKGDTLRPANYRGTAINLCKLFCSILYTQLGVYLGTKHIVPKCQIGFRKNDCTADHVLDIEV